MTLLMIVTAGVVYALLCWLKPFGHCWWCHGTGTRHSLVLRRLRPCPRCRGAGIRLRHGRAVANYLRHVHHDATHTQPTDHTGRSTR